MLAAALRVAETFWAMTAQRRAAVQPPVSLAGAPLGLAFALAVAVTLALICGAVAWPARWLVDPLMQIKRTIPSLALTPLFIVWFGIGETPKVTLIAGGDHLPDCT